jgi:hypothetical protein
MKRNILFLLVVLLPLFTKASPHVFFNAPFGDTAFCVGDSVLVKFNVTPGYFSSTNVFRAEISDGTGSFLHPVVIGTLQSDHDDTLRCRIPADFPSGIYFRLRIRADAPADTSMAYPYNLHLYRFPVIPTASSNTPVCANNELVLHANYIIPDISCLWYGPGNYVATGTDAIRGNMNFGDSGTYVLIANLGKCYAVDSVRVTVFPLPPPKSITSNAPLCELDSLKFTVSDTASIAVSYEWSGPENFWDTAKNAIRTNITKEMSGVYHVKSKLGFCYRDDSIVAEIKIKPLRPDVTSNSPLWPGQDLKVFLSNSIPGTEFTWTGPNGFSSSGENFEIDRVSVAASGTYNVLARIGDCTSSGLGIVIIHDEDVVLVYPNPVKTSFVLSAMAKSGQAVTITIIDASGKIVQEEKAVSANNVLYTVITPSYGLANGDYRVRLKIDGRTRVVAFTLDR